MSDMDDIDDTGWDAEARRHLAALDEVLSEWAERTGDRLAGAESPERPAPALRPGDRPVLEGGDMGTTGRPRPGVRRWAWRSGVVAAAAAVGVLLLVREPGPAPPSPEENGVPLVADGLDAASDKPFLMVPTRNPDIAVIWMLDSGD